MHAFRTSLDFPQIHKMSVNEIMHSLILSCSSSFRCKILFVGERNNTIPLYNGTLLGINCPDIVHSLKYVDGFPATKLIVDFSFSTICNRHP